MVEWQTECLINPARKDSLPPYHLGEPIRIEAASQPNWPSEWPSTSQPIVWGVMTQRETDLFLVGSCSVPSVPLYKHTELLKDHENDFKVTWFHEALLSLLLRRGRGDIPNRVMSNIGVEGTKALFDVFGDPEREGEWLARRLLPRRRPCLFRFTSPTHLQWFIGV